MQEFLKMISSNSAYIFAALIVMIIILLILHIKNARRLKNLQDKYDNFMNGSGDQNIEELLQNYLKDLHIVQGEQAKLIKFTNDIYENMKLCIQNIGVVRYNPFDDMGGDFCFAIALLDNNHNGIILNGIHSRETTHVYAKSVTKGMSEYKLSEEEQQALKQAII